ncbi:MAG: D-alanine--D-alanine ligase [Magnetococcales bacterium]|nr:D-alanine--D-alanine ligase [Magnetococcales bacterium]
MSNQAEHVVVLYGGPSAETEVSKMSAQAVEKAFIEMGTSCTMLEYKSGEWIAELKALNPTFVFIAMHGTPGEDGSVQAVLDELNLPYNGSGMEASVVAMNKSLSKKVLERVQLPVAQEYLLKKGAGLPSTVTHTGLDFPLVVKPNNGGSSVGTEIVMSANAWPAAKERLTKFLEAAPQDMLFEEFIDGRELTVPVFFDKTLGVLEITTEGYEFYDYTSKYSEGGSQHIYPASIATEVKEEAERIALETHKALGCSGITRVDFKYDEEGRGLVVLELNTLPGMTDKSLVPDVAKHNSISFADLVKMMMKDGQCTHQLKSLTNH